LQRHSVALPWLTVERAAWVGVGLLAAALRFFYLAWRPLTEAEASQALAAWQLVQGSTDTAALAAVSSPALFSGQALTFALVGAGDGSARVWPALAGVALALLPWLLRQRLGATGALLAGLLLALSPTALFHARMADGTMLAATAALALLTGLVRYVDTRQPRWLYLAAAALGLGLATAPGFWTVLLAGVTFLFIAWAAAQATEHQGSWSALVVAWRAVREQRGLGGRTMAAAAATWVLSSTALLLYLPGVGAAADLLPVWLSRFLPAGDNPPLLYPLALWGLYEPLPLVLGSLGIAWTMRQRQQGRPTGGDWDAAGAHPHAGSSLSLRACLLWWGGLALTLNLIGGHRTPDGLLWAVVPFALLAGQVLGDTLPQIGRWGLWQEEGLATLAGTGIVAYAVLQVANYGHSADGAYLLLAGVAAGLLVGLAAGLWLWRGWGLTVRAGWLTLLIVLLAATVHAGWSLNHVHDGDPRELMVRSATARDVRTFAAQVERLSWEKVGGYYQLPMTVDRATGPVVAWVLRDMQQLAWVDGVGHVPPTQAVVTLAEPLPPIGETFRGTGFRLAIRWQPWGLGNTDLVRWVLYRDGSWPKTSTQVVLWVENIQ
jgi:uncharacterized protein (TIGR03663 family)